MKVQDIMNGPVTSCHPETNLAEAVGLLWSTDCGVLPVVDAAGRVIAIVSDRDICIAVGTRSRPASDILVKDVASPNVATCRGQENIHSALKTMEDNQVRRLPVLDEAGVLQGMLSLNDAILQAESIAGQKTPELSYNDVMATLKAICHHPAPPAAEKVVAAA